MKVYELMEELGKCEAGAEIKITAVVSDKAIILSEKNENYFSLKLKIDEVYDDTEIAHIYLREGVTE